MLVALAALDGIKMALRDQEAATFRQQVADTPGLRLVGTFQCDPDESGGAA
jgi:hypothetical protein